MSSFNLFRNAALFSVALACLHASAVVNDDGSNPALPAGLGLGGVGQLSNGCSSVLLTAFTENSGAPRNGASPLHRFKPADRQARRSSNWFQSGFRTIKLQFLTRPMCS